MTTYTVTLNESDTKCFEYREIDTQGIVTNFVEEEVRLARLDIVKKLVTHCNENNIAISVGEEAQVNQAFSLGIVKTAKQREDEFMNSVASKDS
tara:strand:- start:184 stop:465 length:282 start_codon:yes stop_codon:yes gene_type:complete